MKMRNIRPEIGVVWILVLLNEVLSAYTVLKDTTCYCFKEELSALRNPVHIEPTILGGKHVYFLAEQLGFIHVYSPSAEENKLTTYVDISDRVLCKPELYEERGLLGIALHPKFKDNQKLYTYSIRTYFGKEFAVISEITNKDVAKEVILMLIEQPGTRRNGGQLLFGDDGYLYISVGDGGPNSKSDIQAQNGNNFLGKVLRIDVDSTTVVDNKFQYYVIPRDNPKKSDWRPEVYAIGARNMWRCSTDKGDSTGVGKGRIFCGDLGSSLADELVELKKGGNYGWPYWEGTICRNNTMCQKINDEIIAPIYEFRREGKQTMKAVVGGPLYRGALFPEMYGQLVYGDYTDGQIFTLKESSSTGSHSNWTSKNFTRCDKSTCPCDARASQRTMLLSFGQTHEGELLALMTDEPTPSKRAGALLRLVPKSSSDVTCGAASGLPMLLTITLTSSLSILLYFAHIHDSQYI